MKLKVQKLNEKDFSRFGQVISIAKREPDHREEVYDWWADLALFDKIDGAYGVGMAVVRTHAFSQGSSERHMKTPEFCMSIDGDMVIIVGPADHPEDPQRLPDLSRFAAFLVPEGEAVILNPGVWHWAPFPIKAQIHFLVVFAAGTSDNDLYVADYPSGNLLEFELK